MTKAPAKTGPKRKKTSGESPATAAPDIPASAEPMTEGTPGPASPPDGASPARAAQPDPVEVLGQVTWLMMNSPAHRFLFYADAEWLLMPPLMLKQFRIFRKDKAPVAYASWARLTEEAEGRLLSGARKLALADWNGGDRLWLIDLVAPLGLRPRFANGGADEILRQLRGQVFEGQKIKALQPAPDGSGMAVVEW